MASDIEERSADNLIVMNYQQLLRVVLIGAIAGAVTWGLTALLNIYIFKSVVCSGGAIQCASSLDYSSAIATIVAGGIVLVGLIRLQIFRSLLVVIATTVSLWGIETILYTWSWQYALLVSVLLFAIGYSLFVWIARIRSFLTVLIIIVVLVVAVRLALNS